MAIPPSTGELKLILATPSRLVYAFNPGESSGGGGGPVLAKRTKAQLLADLSSPNGAPASGTVASSLKAAIEAWPVLSPSQTDGDATLIAIAPGTAHASGGFPTPEQAKEHPGFVNVGRRLWASNLGGSNQLVFFKDTDNNIAFGVFGADEGVLEITAVHSIVG